ncbi:MAG: tRNA uridine-5-carboxymethylaminomethyl(34) synthesis GTPase MnmE [Bacillus sp. (in: Bacteria)]|nr:tRNA uridine-5-carboxymethylaminomethyl(34) synthesis GTPase MnmE [Bacillus sp. (in: firmicutes)]MCM1425355.1 tRNA uridine-5-carboxymethylaminomethyl(34) synthesis GTPase MnmE [Eubacterium sp.]
MKTDTIAAIATAMNDSGIGIIRVSGDEAISIVHSIFVNKENKKCLASYKTHTIHYGFITEEDGTVIDEVMVSIMKAPHSYTMEDTVEINCHGGVFMMKKIMDVVLCAGAKMAQPGEFTKRAFLNGRIDLSKAEAVMDIIHSKNEFALKSSVRQLKGSVSEIVKDLRDKIIYEIAFIESALDDPEHISLDGYPQKLYEKTEDILKRLKKLIDCADDGRILKEGINTVIVGKPNAGKSSLLNRLVGEEKAIVTEIAGTTRDILEETISFSGITLNITDTAGIRNTDDVVEKIGVERAKKVVKEADLVVYVVDASIPLDENDFSIMKMIKDKKTIILLNKSDLDMDVTKEKLNTMLFDIDKDFSDNNIKMIKTSTKENEGIDIFTGTIKNMFFHGELSSHNEIYITNIRHKEAMQNAYDSMMQVQKSIENDMPEDFYSIDLMSAYASLGEIIGEEVGEDLVNKIFSEFCMGK